MICWIFSSLVTKGCAGLLVISNRNSISRLTQSFCESRVDLSAFVVRDRNSLVPWRDGCYQSKHLYPHGYKISNPDVLSVVY